MAAVAAALVLLLAGCAGGDDTADEGSIEPDGTEDATGEPSPSGEDGSGLGALTDADCRQYAQAFQEAPNVADPDSLDGIGQIADILDDAADRVPNEISDDFRVMADAYRAFGEALQDLDVDFNDPESMARLSAEDLATLQAAGEAMGTSEVQEAAENIDAFLQEHCT